MRKVWVIGATSAIAEQTARCFAEEGAEIALSARNAEKLLEMERDLRVRGAAKVLTFPSEVTAVHHHSPQVDEVWNALGGVDAVLIAYGNLPDQKACEQSFDATRDALHVNFVSVVSWLTHIANRMERQKSGTIAVISSVAGDRGRQSNYVYGTAKGALSTFLQGLRHRLYKSGVSVVTIKPGFVATPMTAHLKKGLLFASPKKVGRKIFRAMKRKRGTVYVPCYWRWIMFVIRSIPERVFVKTRL